MKTRKLIFSACILVFICAVGTGLYATVKNSKHLTVAWPERAHKYLPKAIEACMGGFSIASVGCSHYFPNQSALGATIKNKSRICKTGEVKREERITEREATFLLTCINKKYRLQIKVYIPNLDILIDTPYRNDYVINLPSEQPLMTLE